MSGIEIAWTNKNTAFKDVNSGCALPWLADTFLNTFARR